METSASEGTSVARKIVDAIESERENVEVRERRENAVEADQMNGINVMFIESARMNAVMARIHPMNVVGDMDADEERHAVAVEVRAAVEATNANEDNMDGDAM